MYLKSPIPGPTYIIKFLHIDQKYAEEFKNLTASLLPANIAFWKKDRPFIESMRQGCHTLIIDPMTHAFTYPGYLDKQTYRKLPYAPPQPLSANILLSDPGKLKDFTNKVLIFQKEMGAGVFVAPYFYTRDLDDARLIANLRMVQEAAQFLSQLGQKLPLYAWICIGAVVMQSPTQVNEIARLYCELPVKGYMITVEDFDDRFVNAEALMGLTRLLQRLKDGKDVIVCSIASFGQVLTAFGANGFSAGIGWLETFREATLQPGRPAFAADRIPRARYYYLPELLSYIHPDDLEAIFDEKTGSDIMRDDYKCQCEVCIHCPKGFAESVKDKKRHFIIRRQQEMKELSEIAPDKRPQFMRDRIKLALELANIIEEEMLIRIPTEHFVRWIAIIDALSSSSNNPSNDSSQSNIDKIIQEARRNTRDKGSS